MKISEFRNKLGTSRIDATSKLGVSIASVNAMLSLQSPLQKYFESQEKLTSLLTPKYFSVIDRLSKSYGQSNHILNSTIYASLHQQAQAASIAESGLLSTMSEINRMGYTFEMGSSLYPHDKWLEKIQEGDTEILEEEQTTQESVPNIILLETIRVQGIIKSIYDDNDELFRVHHRDFEHVIAELLRDKNFDAQVTKQTRDGGFDIIAIQDLAGFKNKYLVECKRNAKDRPVGIGVVKQLAYTVDEQKANKGILFTSSYFSKDVYAESEKLSYRLDLKNGNEIIDWVGEYINCRF